MNQESPEKNQDIEDQDKKNRGTEHQGTKEKFWFGKNQDKLFKIGKHKGENWAEIVACHLATLLDIPCAKYTLGSIQENSKTLSIFYHIRWRAQPLRAHQNLHQWRSYRIVYSFIPRKKGLITP
jgi:hypothetical protein